MESPANSSTPTQAVEAPADLCPFCKDLSRILCALVDWEPSQPHTLIIPDMATDWGGSDPHQVVISLESRGVYEAMIPVNRTSGSLAHSVLAGCKLCTLISGIDGSAAGNGQVRRITYSEHPSSPVSFWGEDYVWRLELVRRGENLF